MSSVKPDLSQPELPAPHEKLLRAPTFAERYGWFKTILIVAIVVGLLDAGIYFFLRSDNDPHTLPVTPQETVSPTTDPTTSWETYTSKDGKFSLKYPKTYEFYDNVSVTPRNIQVVSSLLPNLNTDFRLTIAYKKAEEDLSFENLISQNKLCPNISPERGTPSILNGSERAQLYIDTPCGEYTQTVVYTRNKGIFYMITIESEAPFSNVKQYTDQVMATLKFL